MLELRVIEYRNRRNRGIELLPFGVYRVNADAYCRLVLQCINEGALHVRVFPGAATSDVACELAVGEMRRTLRVGVPVHVPLAAGDQITLTCLTPDAGQPVCFWDLIGVDSLTLGGRDRGETPNPGPRPTPAADETPKKQAFLVLGPESSGNRVVTRCLIAAGCQGDGGHAQQFDVSLEGAQDRIVWRRSLPHGAIWPDLDSMLGALRQEGYDVFVIALLRNQYCTVLSQLGVGHVAGIAEAERNVAMAIRKIAAFVLENNLPCQYVTYESLIHNFGAFQRALKTWGMDLDHPPEELVDENLKYLDA